MLKLTKLSLTLFNTFNYPTISSTAHEFIGRVGKTPPKDNSHVPCSAKGRQRIIHIHIFKIKCFINITSRPDLKKCHLIPGGLQVTSVLSTAQVPDPLSNKVCAIHILHPTHQHTIYTDAP